tara:strand:+ start:1004 stop:1522 length:519 start_codon:yes stop_codon:yes gene_type:complete
MQFSDDTVMRINLAWVDNIESLQKLIEQYENDIFLDFPIGRSKPPNNIHNFNNIKQIIEKHKNIKYLAISNVENPNDILEFINQFNDNISIVPKIESRDGINNIDEICKVLPEPKHVMLDHDDLFSDLIKKNVNPSDFFSYIEKLDDYCNNNSINLLRTRGVIFSDKDSYNF